jgi:DNA-binding transcriptional regulator YiaG
MSSALKDRFERLGPVRDVSRVASGSSVVMFLRPATNREVKPISATMALAKRGLSMLKAKRTVEEMITKGVAVLELPTVEDRSALQNELIEAGVHARPRAEGLVNVKALRERLGLTQEQFALRYGIDIDTLQNWERRRRLPDGTAQRLLRIIEVMPIAASAAQEDVEAETVREQAPRH